MDTLTKYLAVAAGSAFGGMLRYFLGSTILSRTAALVSVEAAPASVEAGYELYEQEADPCDPACRAGAQRDIRDSENEPPDAV